MLRRSRTTCVTCTFAVVTAKRRECDVYVACTWHRRADIAEDPRVRKLLTVKRPEGRAPAQIIGAALSTYSSPQAVEEHGAGKHRELADRNVCATPMTMMPAKPCQPEGFGSELPVQQRRISERRFLGIPVGESPVLPKCCPGSRFAWAMCAVSTIATCLGNPLLAAERFIVSMPAWVSSLAFSPDSKQLAVGCADSSAHLLEVATGKEMAALRGHEDYG